MPISIIIPFLDAEKYISESIESVLAQTRLDWELILVDDGSTDGSPSIALNYAQRYPEHLQYVKNQESRGASAARNVGIARARYDIIAFLDADDIWLPSKLEDQVSILETHPDVAMVFCPLASFSDSHRQVESVQPMEDLREGVYLPPHLALRFLQNSALTPGPTATVIRKDVLVQVGGFEEQFRQVFTDQSLWQKIASRWPVYLQLEPLVLYRHHALSSVARATATGNMPHHEFQFACWAVRYLSSSPILTAELMEAAFNRLDGAIRDLTRHYGREKNRGPRLTRPDRMIMGVARCYVEVTAECGWRIGIKLMRRQGQAAIRRLFRAITGKCPGKGLCHRIVLGFGVKPRSYLWGFDRGLPIHRYYVEQFLQEFSVDIRGRCLEFQEDSYTSRFGRGRFSRLDVLHKDSGNPRATIVADLTHSNNIPGDCFDCIICTHVLHVIYDVDKALLELFRILKPGGVLLVALPGLSMCDPQWHELWRFTPEGLRIKLAKIFGDESVTVRAYGNSLTAAGEVRGLVTHEFTRAELDDHDPRFAVEVCARAVRRC